MYTLPSVHDVFHCNRRKTMLYYIFSINTVNIKVVSRNFDDWGGGVISYHLLGNYIKIKEKTKVHFHKIIRYFLVLSIWLSLSNSVFQISKVKNEYKQWYYFLYGFSSFWPIRKHVSWSTQRKLKSTVFVVLVCSFRHFNNTLLINNTIVPSSKQKSTLKW